jgi:putative membrane protein
MMVMLILIRWLFIASALTLAAAVVPDVEISGGVLGLLGVAALFGIVNAVVGPVLRLLSLPLTLVTFGLFSLVINGALLALTAGLSSNLDVGGFFAAVLGAFVISVVSAVAQFLLFGRAVQQPA